MSMFSLCSAVDKYSYVINGEAKDEIMKYMEEEHTFEEYSEVRQIILGLLV